ncbi:Bifunctional protein folC [Sebaldella termitidis]|uniref:tetrahydrofolate synthase n=1 Tax=Sebaldella termitidis (strain ATCC 33386 / NCTC 11300) TaxID=526218 RepID=D1AM93_SEBTE|nr:folylpolyglutamate synthase/dihydrofolate synthase family protein [Sebaldella termitidis]ACZ09467.1 FolC bifunctional protein [Sebaldella termitidis ATCC 33386]SUI24797.1 Bifunctional protein folC [Sebaldella termitidis]
MNIDNILNKIFKLRAVPKKNLNNIKFVLKKLGNPEKNLKIIHIAGTNGKGSAASMLESVLITAGYNVGKFTSPHIIKFNERIVYNKKEIPDEEIAGFFDIIEKITEKYNIYLNFFEVTTIIMFCYFNKLKPDYTIIECGLGGRLDATNTGNSYLSVITNISFDHTAVLGNTLKEIAFEKAGIVHDGQICIFAGNHSELTEAVKNKTDNFVDIMTKYKNIDISLDKTTLHTKISLNNSIFEIPLYGIFQGWNFLLVYETAKILKIEDSIIAKGISDVKWPGRFEIYSKDPLIILDAAHNTDSVKVLRDNILSLYPKSETAVIISVLKDKNINEIFSLAEEFTDNIFCTSLSESHRGFTSEELKNVIKRNDPSIEYYFDDDLEKITRKALSLNKKVLIVCGSFYLISKFKELYNL